MESFQFANKEILYSLLLIPVFVFLYILIVRSKIRALKRFGQLNVISKLMPDYSDSKPVIKFSLFMLALIFIIFALSRPQFGSKLMEINAQGAEIIIALDISNSMLAEDIYPNRLEKAKSAIIKMIDNLYEDKIGLIVYAGEANSQIPVTSDYTSTKLFIKSIQPDFIEVQGTAIGAAIRLAMNSFTPAKEESEQNKAIIVISDGENHEDDAVSAAQEASDKGIIVHTIGIGSSRATPIPESDNASDFKKDKDGSIVMTKLNEEMLQEIAQAGKGIYVKASTTNTGLEYIYEEINKIEKGEVASYAEYEDKFQYFIFAAFLMLIIEFFILDRKNRWLSRIKLFEQN